MKPVRQIEKLIYDIKIFFTVFIRMKEIVFEYPGVLFPFMLIAAFDILFLFIIYISPNETSGLFSSTLGNYLVEHIKYALNIADIFILMRNFIGFFIGIFFTGIAISFIGQANRKRSPRWLIGIRKTIKRYIRLLLLWIITLVSVLSILKVMEYLRQIMNAGRVMIVFEMLAAIAIHMFFALAISSVIVENKKITAALKRSVSIVMNYSATTALLVLIPSIALLSASNIFIYFPELWENVMPKAMLLGLMFRVLTITFFDCMITFLATLLLLRHRAAEIRRY
jgi:hypothetical protein